MKSGNTAIPDTNVAAFGFSINIPPKIIPENILIPNIPMY
jgi:hypothetical protein